MIDAVATPKKTAPGKTPAEGRKKSKLTQTGDAAKWEAERALLLKTLKANHWNLTHTSNELEMGHPSAVLTALDRYDLRKDYEKHRAK